MTGTAETDPLARVRAIAASDDLDAQAVLLADPDLPGEIVALLSASEDSGVQRLAASHPRIPVERLRELAVHPSLPVALAALDNPALPREVHAQLAGSPDSDVRAHLARCSSVDPALMLQLARDPERHVRWVLSWNRATPTDVLEILLADPEANVRSTVAGNPNITVDQLTRLARDPEKRVRESVAYADHAPAEVLAILAEDPEKSIQRRVAEHVNADPVTRAKFIKTNAIARGLALATVENVDELTAALNDDKVGVRVSALLRLVEVGEITAAHAKTQLAAFGSNANQFLNRWLRMRGAGVTAFTNREVLDLMIALKADSFIASAVWHRVFTDDELRKIAAAKLPEACWAIAHRVPLTPEWLTLLAAAPSHSWIDYGRYMNPNDLETGEILIDGYITRFPQIIVAQHPDTPAAVLKKLRKARSKYVRASALSRPDTPVEDLIAAASDVEPVVRAAAAAHPATPADAVFPLAGDPDGRVRAAVVKRADLTDEMRTMAAPMGTHINDLPQFPHAAG